MSLSRMTSYISPSVPLALVKPTASASFIEDEPSRRPTLTRMPVPSSDSRRFCAWAGPWEDQPITPICLMPSNALGSSGKRFRPPATMVSSRSAILTVRVWKTFEEKLIEILGPALGAVWRPLWPAMRTMPRGILLRYYDTVYIEH
jgi:hypothetical protein